VGTLLSHSIAKQFGAEGLPEGTLKFDFVGSAGQSFGAFSARGVQLNVIGESNDYTGKGLSGAVITIAKPKEADYKAHENIICGNVALYGATSGEIYINGKAGERFCVRNSGAKAIVEGVGDHGLEYMTGGEAIILGPTGKNLAAGMSGGLAFVWDKEGKLALNFNDDSADLESLTPDEEEYLKSRIENHIAHTGSEIGGYLLTHWDQVKSSFLKIYPRDLKAALNIQKVEAHG
jgi:glutamate synthase (NADPH/NADH) large chain